MNNNPEQCPQCRYVNSEQTLVCEVCETPLPQAGMTLVYSPTDMDKTAIKLQADISNDDTMVSAPSHESKPYQSASASTHAGMAHFKINQVLGQGGMGAVYRAEDQELQRYVALKLFKANLSPNSTKNQVLLDEARIACKLNHPNIVTIYDIARGQDTNFIVMEWVNGESLDKLIPEQGLPLKKAIRYAKQIVDGLASAHQQGIVHRDIKPQNIMLNSDNIIKILDFGIAALLNTSSAGDKVPPSEKGNLVSKDQAISQMIGTPHYMSPEQINAEPLDHRADIFSFGVVLYEMLTGRKPFQAKNIQQLKQAIIEGHVVPLEKIKPETPPEVIELVNKALSAKKEYRWDNTTELARIIGEIDQNISQQKNWWQKQTLITKALLVLPFIALLGWSIVKVAFPPTTEELIQRQMKEAATIAILPFDNISGDPFLQLFVDGLAATLSQDLSIAGLEQGDGTTWVIPASEIRRMDSPNVKNVSEQFGVDLILTGSVQHLGSKRSIVLNLVNAKNGRQLKAKELTIDANQLFEGQALIREEALNLLSWTISEKTINTFNTEKPKFDGAYKEFIEGKGYLYRYDQEGNLDKAISAFESAIAIDPNYLQAYVNLIDSHILYYQITNDNRWVIRAKQTLDTVASVYPNDPLVHYTSAKLANTNGKYQEAITIYQNIIADKPNHIESYLGLAESFSKIGQLAEAEELYKKSLSLKPNNSIILNRLSIFYLYNGMYDKAIVQLQKLAIIAPNNESAFSLLAASYYSLGQIDDAIIYTQKALEIRPTDSAYSNLGSMYFYIKQYDDAVTAFEKAIQLNPTYYIFWGNLADAYRFSNLGSQDKIHHAYQEASALSLKALEVNPNDSMATAFLAYYLANLNNKQEALHYANKITSSNTGYENFLTATTYEALNEIDLAINHLVFALDKNYSKEEILQTPLLNQTKKHPSFDTILATPSSAQE